MHRLLKMLQGGDRRSIGRSDQVAAQVLREPELLPVLIEGVRAADPIVRMRAADAMEKVSRGRVDCLLAYKRELIGLAAEATQQEVRWHLAQVLPRLDIDHRERVAVVDILLGYLSGRSRIVKVSVMQAFAEFAKVDSALRPSLLARIAELTAGGTPAMRARGRKLLEELEQ